MSDMFSWEKVTTDLDINLGNILITSNGAAHMCLSIIEFLLFYRNQIPFVYDTLCHMVNKFEKNKTGNHDDTVKNYALDRHRKKATRTIHTFSEISDVNKYFGFQALNIKIKFHRVNLFHYQVMKLKNVTKVYA